MTAPMTPSPFVGDLIRNIAARDAEDRRSLLALAYSALERSPGAYTCAETPKGQMYIMSRKEVAAYVRTSGFEDWYASTWLSLSPTGELTGDVPLSRHGLQSEESLTALVGSTLRQACSAGVAKFAVRDETEYFGFTGAGLVAFLQLARGTARVSREWHFPTPINDQTVNIRKVRP